MGKLRAFLILSLLVNVVLIGLFLGQWAYRAQSPFFSTQPNLEEKLASQHHQAYRAMVERERRERTQARAQIAELREELQEMLSARNFDPDAYQAKSEELVALHAEILRSRYQRLREFAETLGAEERQALREHLAWRSKRVESWYHRVLGRNEEHSPRR